MLMMFEVRSISVRYMHVHDVLGTEYIFEVYDMKTIQMQGLCLRYVKRYNIVIHWRIQGRGVRGLDPTFL